MYSLFSRTQGSKNVKAYLPNGQESGNLSSNKIIN